MSLRRKKETDGSLPRFEVAHIRCQNRVQVAIPVGPGKRKERAEICVDKRNCAANGAVFAAKIGEACRQDRAKIFAHLRVRGSVQIKQRSFERRRQRWILHMCATLSYPKMNSVSLG